MVHFGEPLYRQVFSPLTYNKMHSGKGIYEMLIRLQFTPNFKCKSILSIKVFQLCGLVQSDLHQTVQTLG